jgi:hypothetical protein
MQRHTYPLSLLLTLACAGTAISPPPPPPPAANIARADSLDERPPWSYEELRTGALYALAPMLGYSGRERPPVGTIREMRVLAWHVREDTAGLRIERALLWLLLSGEPQLWALANLYRHPNTDSAWRPATATHAVYFGARLFVEPPRNAEVYALLDVAGNWSFGEDPAAPLLSGDVRQRTWTVLMGEAPTRLYGHEDPQEAPGEYERDEEDHADPSPPGSVPRPSMRTLVSQAGNPAL